MAEEKKIGKEVGRITHYFDKIGVAVVELSGNLKKGDKIRIKGNTTDFEQLAEEMQIEHQTIQKAGKGDAIGLKVMNKVRENDRVYIVK